MYDTDFSGFIEYGELMAAFQGLGFKPSKEEIKKIITDLDKDGNGKLDFDEFRNIALDKLHNRDPREEVQQAFGYFED